MLHTRRDHDHLSRAQCHQTIAKLDPEYSSPYEEHFVRGIVMMPWKDALYFDQFHFLPVQARDDLWPPMLGKQRELAGQVDPFHQWECRGTVFFRSR